MKYFCFTGLLQSSGWISPAYVAVDDTGRIQSIKKNPPSEPASIEHIQGYALPGFQNAHSHAFQYAMAGKAEIHQQRTKDDFWSWREAMYACALAIDPDQMQAIATMLYTDMLRRGYTHVAEFHYLHHNKDGKRYENLAEMGERLVAAAVEAGIRITLIPVFYQKGGFGVDPQPRQRRFISKTVEDYLELLEASEVVTKYSSSAKCGASVHSLRAVEGNDIIKTVEAVTKHFPFHLHAAEQLKEVGDALQYTGQRPVEWILNNLSVDKNFHLVHCTHMNDDEVQALAKSGANVVLCPGTEGNLGDGIFRLSEYASHGGNWSIGTDSHISLNFLEDLRWLDYAQRLTTHKRNTFDNNASVLFNQSLFSGRVAMGLKCDEFFEVGNPLDAVVFNAKSPLLSGCDLSHVLSVILYTTDSSDVSGTIVNGKWIVRNQHHINSNKIVRSFRETMKSLSF